VYLKVALAPRPSATSAWSSTVPIVPVTAATRNMSQKRTDTEAVSGATADCSRRYPRPSTVLASATMPNAASSTRAGASPRPTETITADPAPSTASCAQINTAETAAVVSPTSRSDARMRGHDPEGET
jgi:hypothetical protein